MFSCACSGRKTFPDGKEIVFDRVRENADIVRMDLAR